MSEIKTFKIKTTKYSLFLPSLVKGYQTNRNRTCLKIPTNDETYLSTVAGNYINTMKTTSDFNFN